MKHLPVDEVAAAEEIRREAVLGRLHTGPHDAPERRGEQQRPDIQALQDRQAEQRRDNPSRGDDRAHLQTPAVPAVRKDPGHGAEQRAQKPHRAHETHQERRVGEVEHQPSHQDPVNALRQTGGAAGAPQQAKIPVVQGPEEAPRCRGGRARVVGTCMHHAYLSAQVRDQGHADGAPACRDVVRAYPIMPSDACLLSGWRDESPVHRLRSSPRLHGVCRTALWSSAIRGWSMDATVAEGCGERGPRPCHVSWTVRCGRHACHNRPHDTHGSADTEHSAACGHAIASRASLRDLPGVAIASLPYRWDGHRADHKSLAESALSPS